jgi:hypothetical protein
LGGVALLAFRARGDHKTRRTTARDGTVVSQSFRITHPFHPQTGREFEVAERRAIRGQDLVFYLDPDGCLRSISASFTSLAIADTVVALGAGRSRFRTEDLLTLQRLLEDMTR